MRTCLSRPAMGLVVLLGWIAIMTGCNSKSDTSVAEVKEATVGTWISAALDAEYVKITFKADNTYELWSSTGFTRNWGKVLLKGTYSIKMDKGDGGLIYPVVILNNSSPYNYRIAFEGKSTTLRNADMLQIPISKTTKDPWN